MKSWHLIGILYLVLVVALAVTLGSFNLARYYRLAQSGYVTTGTVTKTDCDHGRVYYSFPADDKQYSGSARHPDCGSVAADDPIDVSYLPEDPNVNTIGMHASAQLATEAIAVGAIAFLAPAILIAVLAIVIKIRRRSR
jgi:hypothetical protein